MKKREALLLTFFSLIILLVTLISGCGGTDKPVSDLPKNLTMAGEMADRGAVIADSGHSQAAASGQATEPSSPDILESAEEKTSGQASVASGTGQPAVSTSPLGVTLGGLIHNHRNSGSSRAAVEQFATLTGTRVVADVPFSREKRPPAMQVGASFHDIMISVQTIKIQEKGDVYGRKSSI
ncbi:MAG: hypothetical protein ACYDEJ_08645 [Desulfitobacteriaceae bacterium]